MSFSADAEVMNEKEEMRNGITSNKAHIQFYFNKQARAIFKLPLLCTSIV